MTTQEKLAAVKVFLDIPSSDTSLDAELSAYLDMAGQEVLNWMYINKGGAPRNTAVPTKYENTQIMGVVNGYNHKGAEGEKIHNENGINRTFVYGDMIAYIRSHVYQLI